MRKLDKNPEITEKAAKCGIYYWQIAEFLKIADTTFSRKMRYKLDEQTRLKVIFAIEALSGQLNEPSKKSQ